MYSKRTFQKRAKGYLPKITAAILLAVIFAFANVAFAAGTGSPKNSCPEGASAAACAKGGLGQTASVAGLGTTQTIPDIIGTLIYAALSLTGVIFVILIVYAGYLWMTARGTTEDADKAKKIIENAIIGIIITGLAFAITNFVLNRIVESTSGTTITGGVTGEMTNFNPD